MRVRVRVTGRADCTTHVVFAARRLTCDRRLICARRPICARCPPVRAAAHPCSCPPSRVFVRGGLRTAATRARKTKTWSAAVNAIEVRTVWGVRARSLSCADSVLISIGANSRCTHRLALREVRRHARHLPSFPRKGASLSRSIARRTCATPGVRADGVLVSNLCALRNRANRACRAHDLLARRPLNALSRPHP